MLLIDAHAPPLVAAPPLVFDDVAVVAAMPLVAPPSVFGDVTSVAAMQLVEAPTVFDAPGLVFVGFKACLHKTNWSSGHMGASCLASHLLSNSAWWATQAALEQILYFAL